MSDQSITEEYEYEDAEGKPLKASTIQPYFISLIGPDAGRIFEIGPHKHHTIGRMSEATISLNDSTVSRHHATATRLDSGDIEVTDNRSTNGIFCNGEKIQRQILRHDDRILIGLNTILRFSTKDPLDENCQRQETEERQRDALTECFNQRYLLDRLPQEQSYARQHSKEVTLCLFDVDGLRALNENYGEAGGDQALRHVAHIGQASLRRQDELSRYGADSFAVLLRETTAEGAERIAARLCKNVANRPVEIDTGSVGLTICVGLVTLTTDSDADVARWLAAAEEQLRTAQEDGVNRIAATSL